MQRRTFLRTVTGAGAAVLLAACGRGGAGSSAPAPSATSAPPTTDPVALVAPDAERSLSMISASFERLTGQAQPFAFGLVGADNEPVTGAEARVWVVPANGGQAQGPFDATFNDVPNQPLGVYVATVDVGVPGPTSFVAVTEDGRAGSDAVQVATPETSQLPAPGQRAVSVRTPTAEDQMDFETLCTADPPCGNHAVSLDRALAEGRPVMLQFATPAFCETAVCGPSVSVLDEVRTSRDWGDVAFVHVEVYTDAGQTLAPQVEEWELPSEPWLFAINSDGVITARADGPLLTLPEQVSAMAEQLRPS